MKRVRFESPLKVRDCNIMNHDYECHSPRPFIEKQTRPFLSPTVFENFKTHAPRVIPFTNDPIQKFEVANSSPYPKINKTAPPTLNAVVDQKYPSSELDLSILDTTCYEPRRRLCKQDLGKTIHSEDFHNTSPVIKPVNDIAQSPPNILKKSDDFFLKRENIDKLTFSPLCNKIKDIKLDKENNPLIRKTEIMKLGALYNSGNIHQDSTSNNEARDPATPHLLCNCHHCLQTSTPHDFRVCPKFQENHCMHNYNQCCHEVKHNLHTQQRHLCSTQKVPFSCPCASQHPKPTHAVDKQAWLLERYQQNKSECLDIEKQNTLSKEKREPTVSDLFKIIKLQNEQLQLLQEKVDKFIEASNKKENNPIQNFVSEQVALHSDQQHKISIGVMTSFEMVRTSTIINKEVIKQSEAQIQCNRSQISIKEVVSKGPPVNINFLEGITKKNDSDVSFNGQQDNEIKSTVFEDKTLNELSLYNVQVDNAITPQISPEQSMYLDVKDYSESDTDSDDQAHIGWTYYNKVMTRVNGMLQDSDMPSSASAMYRNTRQKCLLQIDKTNVSVTKRVTFGEHPIEIQQPVLNAPSTDTSLKMNQLAAKYLNRQQVLPSIKNTNDVSFATKNYMEKHNIVQGDNILQAQRPQQEVPKFLDITVLKQQPKFL